MKQGPQGYNITSDTLELVRNTLKIMRRFSKENFDKKILTIFLQKVDCFEKNLQFLQKNFTIFGRKFNAFCKKT